MDRHLRLTRLFHAGVQLGVEQRRALLDRHGQDDDKLRVEVEELWRLEDGATCFLADAQTPDALRQAASEALEAAEVAARVNDMSDAADVAGISGYEVLRELGSGAMGRVYLARQETTQQLVALKVLRPELSLSKSARRFKSEVEILGRLDHPGIARIYDAGASITNGVTRPYFAMEFVRGQRLGQWLITKRPSLDHRLAVLSAIADAVHHAHQSGVIHRDLKPDNVLVEEDGRVKVLDFGIARAVDVDVQRTSMGTDMGQLIGTLHYMSPEQTLGDVRSLDRRSDVYALGVMGYELIESRLPYELEGLGLVETLTVIQEDDPMAMLSGAAGGDLETIIGKAMEKEKHRRYGSAARMADDLGRYLRHEPVAARPPSALYHLAKFSRRHKEYAIGVLAVFLVLSVATALSLRLAAQETAARQEADERAAVANVYAANLEMIDGGLLAARELLALVPDAYRLWEWRLLSNMGDLSVATFKGHRYRVAGLAISPDGGRLFSCGGGGAVLAWDVEEGRLLQTVAAHNSSVSSVAMNPQGDLLASSSDDGSIRLYDGLTLAETAVVAAEAFPRDLQFTPNGRLLTVAFQSGFIASLDVMSGEEVSRFRAHTGTVEAIAYSPDGSRLVSCSEDEPAAMWSASEWQQIAVLEAAGSTVLCAAFNPAGTELATGCDDGTVILWSGTTGERLSSFAGHEKGIRSIGFSPDGLSLATGSDDGNLRVWRTRDQSLRKIFVGHTGVVSCLAWSPDGAEILTGSWDNEVKTWSADQVETQIYPAYREECFWLDMDPLLGTVAFSYPDGRLVQADPSTGEETAQLADFSELRSNLVRRGGEVIASMNGPAVGDGFIIHCKLYRENPAVPRFEFEGTGRAIALSPDGAMLAIPEVGSLSLYSTITGELLAKMPGMERTVRCLTFSPSGDVIVGCGDEAGLYVWDAVTGELIRHMEGAHDDGISRVVFNATGELLASNGADGLTRLWDTATLKQVGQLKASGGAAHGVAFHPTEPRIAVASIDGPIRLWDTTSFEQILTIRGVPAILTQLGFTNDGDFLIGRTGDRYYVFDGR